MLRSTAPPFIMKADFAKGAIRHASSVKELVVIMRARRAPAFIHRT